MVLNDVSDDKVNDVDYCCKNTFVGLFNGFGTSPLWGEKQMFIVINRGTNSGTSAYQIAFGYNTLDLRARKCEGSGEWKPWYPLKVAQS